MKNRRVMSYAAFVARLKHLRARQSRFEWEPGDIEVHAPPKKDRSSRFTWKKSDVVVHDPKKRVDEKTYDEPDQEPPDYEDHHSKFNHETRQHLGQFQDHAKAIEDEHAGSEWSEPSQLKSIRHYKANGFESINSSLRHDHTSIKHDDSMHEHIKQLDKATSHKTTHDMHVYRGVPKSTHPFANMHPGTEFTDHGYSSTSHEHSTARAFASNSWNGDKRHIFKIHVPAGSMAHHFDAHENDNGHEGEVVLHRGTRFRVTHHSSDASHHYIHATVVGHEPRDLDSAEN
jgi:ADP-ribosyltransferase exoenzyme